MPQNLLNATDAFYDPPLISGGKGYVMQGYVMQQRFQNRALLLLSKPFNSVLAKPRASCRNILKRKNATAVTSFCLTCSSNYK